MRPGINMMQAFFPDLAPVEARDEAMLRMDVDLERKEQGRQRKSIEELKEAFAIFDKEKTGKITIADLKEMMHKVSVSTTGSTISITDFEFKSMIHKFDKDGDGEIDFGEFCEMMGKQDHPVSHDEEMKRAFRTFDIDGDGVISMEELEIIMKCLDENISDQDLIEMIESADRDGNGVIDYEEFIQMMS